MVTTELATKYANPYTHALEKESPLDEQRMHWYMFDAQRLPGEVSPHIGSNTGARKYWEVSIARISHHLGESCPLHGL